MSRATRGPRPTYYVCVGPDPDQPGESVSKQIQATSQAEAAHSFMELTKTKAKKIHGPYLLKRAQVPENTRELKFAQETHKAIYDNWHVTAMYLKEPENHAYLVLHERVDGQKIPAPKGTIIVPISDLRFDNE